MQKARGLPPHPPPLPCLGRGEGWHFRLKRLGALCSEYWRWTHTNTNQLQIKNPWQPVIGSVTMHKELKIHRCITESSFSFGLDLPWAYWGEGVRILNCQHCPGQPIQIQSSDLCCTEETLDKSHRSPCWRRCCTSNDGLNSTNGLND